MEKNINVKVSLSNLKQMYDEDGMKIPTEKLEGLMYDKLVEVIKEYVEDGGVTIDFLNSEFGVDEAEDLSYYGEIKLKIEDGINDKE